MTRGRLIAVVGPSGVGKDSVMAGIHAALPGLHLVRRVITRAPELGGEDHDAVTVAEFEDMVTKGSFALHWGAHGLFYGIPAGVKNPLNSGTDCLANLSRSALAEAAGLFPSLVILNVTARRETLAYRLAARGRETKGEISKRLERADTPLPQGLNIIHLPNDDALSDTIARATAALQPARA